MIVSAFDLAGRASSTASAAAATILRHVAPDIARKATRLGRSGSTIDASMARLMR